MPDAANIYAPVNIAKPKWACPHCGKTFGEDHDAAAACAAAGPAVGSADSVAVLDLSANYRHSETGPQFGFTETGPVERVVDENRRVVGHRRAITLNGRAIDPSKLSGDPVNVIVREVTADADGERYYSGESIIKDAFGESNTRTSSWVTPGSDGLRPIRQIGRLEETQWFAPLSEEQRAAMSIVASGFTRLSEADPVAMVDELLNTDQRRLQQMIGRTSATIVGFEALTAVVYAHGASNRALGVRFLTDHVELIAEWACRTAVEWANGEQVTCPPLRLNVDSTLPRSPGKKRLAVLAEVGAENYNDAMRTVLDAVRVDAPENPVPTLGDAVDEYQRAAAAARKERT